VEIVCLTADIDLSTFSCGDEQDHHDLDDFLKTEALLYATRFLGQTYLALEHSEVAGYITLLNDMIKLSSIEKEGLAKILGFDPPNAIPALKIGRLARNIKHQRSGVGTTLIRLAFDKLIDQSEQIGCRFLSVDAIPSALKFYADLGFVNNLHNSYTSRTKDTTTSMRFDAFASTLPAWTY